MAPTLKPSEQGLARIKQAREERGWTIEDPRWLIAASQILDPETQWHPGGDRHKAPKGCSETTWKRFLKGESINPLSYKAFCQMLELNWEDTVYRLESPTRDRCQDWGTAPDVPVFYGRSTELATLEQWILEENCRLVGLLGLGGIGKTTLAVRLGKQLKEKFDYIIWRSLDDAPPVERTIASLLQTLSRHTFDDRASGNSPNSPTVGQLIECMRDRRCLILLDDVHVVQCTGQIAGKYQNGYEGYGQLFKQVAQAHHQSCLVLTSWEKPNEIAVSESPNQPVRSLTLQGLGEAAKEILREKGLPEEELWEELIRPYGGNPLALKIVAASIQHVFGGSVSEFLIENTLFLGDFEYLLYSQFNRCSVLEQQIMSLLAAEPEQSISMLHKAIAEVSQSQVIHAMESLLRRSLVERQKNEKTVYTLQPVIRKYVRTHFTYEN